MAVGICGFIGLCFCQSLADSWHIETVDSVGDVGAATSIALDSSGYPHISYIDWTNNYLNYAYWTGTHWLITAVDTSGAVCSNTSIALDSQGYPHIAYSRYYLYEDLMYAYLDSFGWHITSVDTVGAVGGSASLALDSSDYPHISYLDFSNWDLKYAYWTGYEWSIASVDTDGEVGFNASLTLDSSGYPHISYLESIDTIGNLEYACWNGSEWSITLVDTAGDVGHSASLALDSLDYPHISYYDETNGDLKYAFWTGSIWSITSVDTAEDVGWDTSLALDSSDYPHISYFDASNADLKYAYWTGSSWSITSIDTVGDVGFDGSLALDTSDNPHISYSDFSNNDLKYAWYEPTCQINLLSFTVQAKDKGSIVLNWQVETTPPMAGGEQIAGFNLYRRPFAADVAESYSFPLQEKNQGWVKINPSLITGQNPYSYADYPAEGGANPDEGGEYRLEAVLADKSTEILGTASCAPTPPAFAITRLYPNPASDMLTCLLSIPNAGLVNLELYDLSGRLVASQKLEAGKVTELEAVMDVSSLASGVYTLQATCNGAEAKAQCVVAR
jgi:hypothetical protein